MAVALALSIDAGAGLARVRSAFDRLPAATDRALARALRKLATWLRRQTLRAAAMAAAVPQKFLLQALRFHVSLAREAGRLVGVAVWVGTNPVGVHRLGAVRWSQRMRGARVGRRGYPGAWSWGRGQTGHLVMRRTGDGRLPIERVDADIHAPILARLQGLQAEASARFETLLMQELRYALDVEARA
jgi:hypothetical protein